MKLSAIVLTKNEERNIASCIDSIRFCDEVLVLDDHSSDKTVIHAKTAGARVISYNGADDFSLRRNEALKHAQGEWVLFIDADERVSQELKTEIQEAVGSDSSVFNGLYLIRQDVLWGKRLRFGESAHYPIVRLGKKGSGVWTRPVHETWQIAGRLGYIRTALTHYPHHSIAEFLSSINHYSSLRAEELYKEGKKSFVGDVFLYPCGKFFVNYIIKLSILDGMHGLIATFMMSFYSFLVRAKLWQKSRQTKEKN